jgi:uncharacterized protein (DUF2062 family)
VGDFFGRAWQRLRAFVIYDILGVDDTPHRVALGVAVGIFITFMPLIGFQMGLIVLLSTLLRANKVVGVPLAWITNPATLWLFVPGYWLGCVALGARYDAAVLWSALTAAFGIHGAGLSERFTCLVVALSQIVWPLFVGSSIVALPLGVASYFLTLRGIAWYHRHRERLEAERAARAASAPLAHL